ncbi:hypothetical protein [Citrobacter freundii]|uniref:hypothetical protein n=1 Tax=Citrobacter freundii TaxID=546 RepID=UPI0020B88DCB|nr:hypothetical protein [Citrobacter freundii]
MKKLSDLCEVLGYKRPKPQMHNLVEMYSAIFKYLLRTSDESFGYSPTTSRSIKTLGVYKYVDHLSNEKNWPKDAVLAELKNKGTKIYINKIGEKRGLSGNEKFLERLNYLQKWMMLSEYQTVVIFLEEMRLYF